MYKLSITNCGIHKSSTHNSLEECINSVSSYAVRAKKACESFVITTDHSDGSIECNGAGWFNVITSQNGDARGVIVANSFSGYLGRYATMVDSLGNLKMKIAGAQI